jgi:hypothetical protein
MTKVEEIERAVTALSADELSRFREWYAAFEARLFDDRIEASVRKGELDAFADEALADARAGHIRRL